MRIAVMSIILEEPDKVQGEVNQIISDNKHIIKGRMGIPMEEAEISIICLIVCASLNEINAFNGKLGKLSNVQVKTSFSQKEINGGI